MTDKEIELLDTAITRLTEEYNKCFSSDEWSAHERGAGWKLRDEKCGSIVDIDHEGDWYIDQDDAVFIADSHNSMPLLLKALEHFRKHAEAGKDVADCLEGIARMVCTEVDCEASVLGEANAALSTYRKTINSLAGKDNESSL